MMVLALCNHLQLHHPSLELFPAITSLASEASFGLRPVLICLPLLTEEPVVSVKMSFNSWSGWSPGLSVSVSLLVRVSSCTMQVSAAGANCPVTEEKCTSNVLHDGCATNLVR